MDIEEKRAKQRLWACRYREKNRAAINEKSKIAMRAARARDPEKAKAQCRASHHKNRASRLAAKNALREVPAFRVADNAKRLAHHHANREQANVTRRANLKKQRIAQPWAKFFHAAQQRAKKKNVPFELTPEWVAERWTGRCEITEIEFSTSKTTRGPAFFSPSLDRIRPELGYVPGNCRFVLWAVNAFKSGGTDDDMLLVAEAIVAKMRANAAT